MNYVLHILILVEIYLILTLSLNLMVGYTGLLSLAHAAFYGIGAYLTTLLSINFGLSFVPSLALAIIGVTALSFLLSSASLRFKGDYFILITLAFQTITFTILNNWVNVTRGPFGISGIPKPSLFGFRITSLPGFAAFGFAVTLLVFGLLAVIFKSPFGRTLQAIRDDELAAIALGKSAISFKVRSVAIASGCAAVAGAVYSGYITFIDPTGFTTDESILMLSMVIVGGTGNVKGPVAGAVLLVLLPELLRFLALPDFAASNIRLIIYGLLLVLVMRFRPRGLAGKYQFE